MKKRALEVLAILMAFGTGCVWAEDAPQVVTELSEAASEVEKDVLEAAAETELLETASEAETEESGTAPVVESIVLKVGEEDPVTIQNTAGLDIVGISAIPCEGEEALADVTLAGRDGTLYEFKKVKYKDMLDPQLVMDGAFAFVRYTGLASGKERSVGQSGEFEYAEGAELYAIDDVYIRSKPDSDSEILGVIHRGDAILVLGETATHYIVMKDDVKGYTVRKCISEDEQEALAAVKAEEAARAQIRAAAEAAAAAAAQQAAAVNQSSSGSDSGSSSVYEVSRQRFDDCDGSGHGYYMITYSDGSTGIEEY